MGDKPWHVMSYNLTHNHFCDPFIYVHLTLGQEERELLALLVKSNVQMSQILVIMKQKFGISMTVQQVRKIPRIGKHEGRAIESGEVHDYV